jgi:3-phosphoshikimate 1-carboxyvinyltransferase
MPRVPHISFWRRHCAGEQCGYDILEEVGCHVVRGRNYIEVIGREPERGDMVFNMSHMPDMVPSLAVLSAFRPGQTMITGVPHLRIKESNRIESLVAELNRIGITTHALPDGLVIKGGRPHGGEIETYEDHRIAMSFAVAGLVVKGITIKNEDCVGKSFPGFWHTLDGLYA